LQKRNIKSSRQKKLEKAKPFLFGKNILLSPLTEADISDDYISWFNDREVCRDNSHAVFPNTYKKTAAYLKSIENSKTDFVFSIRWKKNKLHIGNVSLQNINWVNRSAEIAIIIGNKNYWNKGVGSEAYQLILDYGFGTLNLNRIASGQTITNKGMIKVCKKNGMKREGLLRQVIYKEGKYLDAVIFTILKKEFEK